MQDPVLNPVGESVAALAVVGVFANLLPPLAAAAAIVWYGFQIWESAIGRRWRLRWRRLLINREPLTIEDKLAFLLTGLFGAAVGLASLGAYRLMGI